MFFGGSKEPESIAIENLAPVLRDEFNRKLSRLESKAAGIVTGIASSVKDFVAACDAFRNLEKEPDLEYVRTTSSTYVKDQKNSYSNLLSRMISNDTKEDARYETIYDRYYEVVQRTGAFLNDILKANAQFKMVLDAYPNDLNKFKKSFSSIELQWRMLKTELEARNMDFKEYHETLGKIQALMALIDEAKTIESAMAELEGAPQHAVKKEEVEGLAGKIASIRSQEQAINRKISEVNSEIGILIHTIEKPARKHDYLSLYKPKLTPLLDDPSSLRNEDKYSEFYKQIGEISGEVEKGTIAVKNMSEVRDALEKILEGRLKSMLDEVTDLESNKLPLDAELRDLERMKHEMENLLNGDSQRESALAGMRNRSVSVKEDIEKIRSAVEGLFERYYKRRIRVAL